MKINRTRIDYLGYANVAPGLWRVVDLSDGRNAAVGPQYATKAELLADFERYYGDSWAAKGQVVLPLHVLFGEEEVRDFGLGRRDRQIASSLESYEFESEDERKGFIRALQVCNGDEDFAVLDDAQATELRTNGKVNSACSVGRHGIPAAVAQSNFEGAG